MRQHRRGSPARNQHLEMACLPVGLYGDSGVGPVFCDISNRSAAGLELITVNPSGISGLRFRIPLQPESLTIPELLHHHQPHIRQIKPHSAFPRRRARPKIQRMLLIRAPDPRRLVIATRGDLLKQDL